MTDVFEHLAEFTGLSGTGEERPPPLFYRILMRVFPPLVRSLTNVRYEGLHNLPKDGAVILAGNHTSHIDPIAVIMGSRRPVRYLAKSEHFDGGITKIAMLTTGRSRQIVKREEVGLWLKQLMFSKAVDGWGYFPRGLGLDVKSPHSSNREKQVSHVWGRSFPMRR